MTTSRRVLVADYAPTRLGIRLALEGQAVVCAEASNVEQAIRAAKREQPEICLLGRGLSGGALAAIRGICRAAPGAAVVILAEVRDAEDMLAAIRAGAVGYVPGAPSATSLQRIIRAIGAGEAVLPRSMVLELVMELRGRGSGHDALTRRESQVLGMLRRGCSTATIAERLEIAPVTVRRHISELVHKFGVENRAGLVAASRTNGWRGSALGDERTAA